MLHFGEPSLWISSLIMAGWIIVTSTRREQKYSAHGWASRSGRRNIRGTSRPINHKLTLCKNDNYFPQFFYLYCLGISDLLPAAPASPKYLALVCFLCLSRFLGLDVCRCIRIGNLHQFPSGATV